MKILRVDERTIAEGASVKEALLNACKEFKKKVIVQVELVKTRSAERSLWFYWTSKHKGIIAIYHNIATGRFYKLIESDLQPDSMFVIAGAFLSNSKKWKRDLRWAPSARHQPLPLKKILAAFAFMAAAVLLWINSENAAVAGVIMVLFPLRFLKKKFQRFFARHRPQTLAILKYGSKNYSMLSALASGEFVIYLLCVLQTERFLLFWYPLMVLFSLILLIEIGVALFYKKPVPIFRKRAEKTIGWTEILGAIPAGLIIVFWLLSWFSYIETIERPGFLFNR